MYTKFKKLILTLFTILINFGINSQTTLLPGDIAILKFQADTPDDFAFVTFVNLDAGTVIYFTDCGADASGFNLPACNEGAKKYTVPTGGHTAGIIVNYSNGSNTNFTTYQDTRITGNMNLSTGGDQIIVFQDGSSSSGSSNAGNNPQFIFALQSASTQFMGDKSDSNETGMPSGLQNTIVPFTALALGTGPGPDTGNETDNLVYSGQYTFTTIEEAKLAITDPNNYYKTNSISDPTYLNEVSTIPASLIITSVLSSSENFNIDTSISFYPNPSNGKFKIENRSGILLKKIKITDLSGRIIASIKYNGTIQTTRTIDLSTVLSSGIYMCTIEAGNKFATKKLIVN